MLRFNSGLFSELGDYESKIPLGGDIDQEITGLAGIRACLWSFPRGEKHPANDLCFPQILCNGTILDMSNLKFLHSSDYMGCPDCLGTVDLRGPVFHSLWCCLNQLGHPSSLHLQGSWSWKATPEDEQDH